MSGMEQLYNSIQSINSRDHIEAAIQIYVDSFTEHDLDIRTSIFAEDASFSDPANAPAFRGLSAIKEFWLGLKAAPFQMKPVVQQIVVCGDSALLDFTMYMISEEETRALHVRDIFEFNGQGKIQSLKAFWDPSCLTES